MKIKKDKTKCVYCEGSGHVGRYYKDGILKDISNKNCPVCNGTGEYRKITRKEKRWLYL